MNENTDTILFHGKTYIKSNIAEEENAELKIELIATRNRLVDVEKILERVYEFFNNEWACPMDFDDELAINICLKDYCEYPLALRRYRKGGLMQRCEVSGIFTIEVESKDCREAKEKAQRILHNSGIAGHVVSVKKKKKEDKHE